MPTKPRFSGRKRFGSITKIRIAKDIFVLRFDTQYALASTFLRVQEHCESRRFRNRAFSLEEFMDWYAVRFGAFTYYDDWSGFNVPSTAFTAFYDGRFEPLLRKERLLLSLFKKERRPFYVIGIAADEDLKHELAHALYFTRPSYRHAVRAAMRGYDTSALRKRLAAMGYHRSVLADEAHAYLVSGSIRSARSLGPLRKTLRALYRKYAAEFISR